MTIFKKQELYWKNKFNSEDNLSHLPYVTNFNNTSNNYSCIYRPLSSQVANRIKMITKGSEMGIFLILLTGIECLIHKYTDEENIILGFPTFQKGNKTDSLLNDVLLLKNTVQPNGTFKSLFNAIKLAIKEANEHQKIPFKTMVKNLNLQYDENNSPIINTIVSLNEIHKFDFKKNLVSDTVFQFDLEKDSINLTLFYNKNLYNEKFMNQTLVHLDRIFSIILNDPDLEISKVDYLSELEKNNLLYKFNDTSDDYPKDKTIVQLFEEQVERTPNQLAVVFEDKKLTYSELNGQANQLAGTLIDEGIKDNKFIGILAESSIEMIVGILGVLKAGGAYVPIDPEYPEERINYILNNSGAEILLTQGHLNYPSSYKGKTLLLDSTKIYTKNNANVGRVISSNELAYLIYTSGTTGTPKGVMVEHRNIHNTVQWKAKSYRFAEKDRALMISSFVFDSFITHFFGPIISGSTVYFLNDKQRKDPVAIQKALLQCKITHFQSTPNFLLRVLENMSSKDLQYLKNIVVGGERITPMLIKKLNTLNPKVEICNEYGPTENSVISTMLSITSPEQNISIGQPISNTKIYILGKNNQIQPINVPGELCISGDGLSRGYLNLSKLTAEKFIDNPFVTGERMYRTGDFAKWLPDGNIELIGRVDNQVKIRGYRIELGEVESALLKLDSVLETVVIGTENEDGMQQMCAYFVGNGSLTVKTIREALSRELPDYMIPSYFVQLEEMPLTPNGKIDRKALPAPKGNLSIGTSYLAPSTKIEETLVSIWETVLGVPKIGLLDNFFDLGGDSIKSIQVSSRLYQLGYQMDIKDLFKYPTISSLSPHLKKITRVPNQEEVIGDVLLTPIQRWFFERSVKDNHHFNQAYMVNMDHRIDESVLHKVMTRIVEHHDALRIVFRENANEIVPWNRAITEGELFGLKVVDLTQKHDPASTIEEMANDIQSSIDLSNGPLIKLGLFRCIDGDHLLIVIHHLIVDGVSWRILLEDLKSGYEQALNGAEIKFPTKTDSFQLWAEQLSHFANGPEMEYEREYWNKIEKMPLKTLPKDENADCGLVIDSDVINVNLSSLETEQLLKKTNRAYNTEINDILLTALGMAVHQWTGMEEIVVNLEGHGREKILTDLDITRTVGWFTTQYPVVLEVNTGSGISESIKTIKESLRQIPNKGIGYGLLRYLSDSGGDNITSVKPEISFNYLGQFDQDLEDKAIQISPYSSGESESKHQARSFTIEINGMISDGRLAIGIGYSHKQYYRETMEQFGKLFQANLQEIIRHCVSKERIELTPSDILLKNITIKELDQLAQQTKQIGEIEDVYPLTPMQKGMLFHSLLEPNMGAYFEQTNFDVKGSIDVEVIVKSLEHLVQRHSVLRTNFLEDWNGKPLQIVYRYKKVDFTFEDIRKMDEQVREEWVNKYTNADKLRGFNLTCDSLMRMSIIRMDEQTYRFIWSFHHILMDGWCMPLIINEIFESYNAIMQKRQPKMPVVTPYSNYIEWIEKQNKDEASKYWRDYLEGYEGKLQLPNEKTGNEDKSYNLSERMLTLDKELTQKMKHVANENQITINSLIQAAWGALLQKYNNNHDVVFGNVVSGRPSTISGIENMIGLFINTIPVRIQCDANESIKNVAKRIQKQAIDSNKYDFHPLYEIQSNTEQKQDLITHIMVFENYPMDEINKKNESHQENKLKISNADIKEQTNYDLNIIIAPGEEFNIRFNYNENKYELSSIEQISSHLHEVLKQIINNPQICINELELITKKEKAVIMEKFNHQANVYQSEKLIHQLFEEQVDLTPDHLALVFEDEIITYRQLNDRANQLARTLRENGVKEEQLIGILVDRSIEMIVGILGILKAGAAYVPIDPEYPEDRIRYMLEDSSANVLVLQRRFQNKVSFSGEKLFLDDNTIYEKDRSNLELKMKPNQLAYVIYTSGTTGNPKGILTTHQNITRVVKNTNYININSTDTLLQLSSYAFDGSTFDIYGSLLNGAKLVLISKEALLDMEKLSKIIVQKEITILFITTALFNVIVDVNINCLSNIKKILFGGERASVSHIRRAVNHIGRNKIVHVYGPTESTVFATYYNVDEVNNESTNIPIGKPITNTTAYILSKDSQLQPAGVAGELCLGGTGLASGYLNRPELTKDKFVDNPFIPGERIYRTGDLVQWRPDGNIEYLGRIDHQVKIRGFRIELGEIEAALLKIESIQEAIVIARDSEEGTKQLYAYFVGDKELSSGQLRNLLSKELPEYMIPSYFVQLSKMPLTSNGKVDSKSLPEVKGMQTNVEYVAPQNKVEKVFIDTCQMVLGVQRIGMFDNFFDLGGDSIKAIQVSSKLSLEGYHLEMKNWFKYQTIAELSEQIKQVSRTVDQKEVVGEVKLTPIQHWFFDNHKIEPNHFNQSIMLYREQGFDERILQKVMKKIVGHHDALRMVFNKTQSGYLGWNKGIEDNKLFSLEVVNLRQEENPGYSIEQAADRIQSSMNLSNGPLMRLGLFRCAEGDHLLIAIHHLVIDGVSWRILLEDIGKSYEQEMNGETIQFPPKTDSFQTWAEQLSVFSNGTEMEQEKEYWKQIEQTKIKSLSKDYIQEQSLVKDTQTITIQLEANETDQLLKQTHYAYNTEINDLLLSALGMAIQKWTGMEKVLVNLEGHGREAILPNLDITRTVGWFTTQYPVVLEMKEESDISNKIITIREKLREIPNKGIGYGILRYLSSHFQDVNFNIHPEISFNYLGQFDQDNQGGLIELSNYSRGSDLNVNQKRQHEIDMNGMIIDGKFSMTIGYSGAQFNTKNMEDLAELYKDSLKEIIDHCVMEYAKRKKQLNELELIGTSDLKEAESFLDKLFNGSFMKEIPGIMFIMVKDGKVAIRKGYGYSDIERQVPMDPDKTKLKVGSITKLFTTAIMMQLAESGDINLQEDIQMYLEDIKIPKEVNFPLTIEHLMSYTTGFDYPEKGIEQLINSDDSSPLTLKEFIQQNMPKVIQKPGDYYKYENFSYVLQGYIIEKLTGVSFYQFANTRILEPLKMNNSSFLMTSELQSELATGYDMDNSKIPEYLHNPIDTSTGSMVSTGEDIAKFMMMMLQQGMFEGKHILNQSSVKQVLSLKPNRLSEVAHSSYGFETNFHPDYLNKNIFAKSGNIPGYSSFMWLIPEKNTGVFVASNKSFMNNMEIFETFMDHFYPSIKSTKLPV